MNEDDAPYRPRTVYQHTTDDLPYILLDWASVKIDEWIYTPMPQNNGTVWLERLAIRRLLQRADILRQWLAKQEASLSEDSLSKILSGEQPE
jgi:hypothetical protein